MEMKATDLSARLLATENLSVIRARTRTASFDIKSRVLTLPMWKEMTPEIEDMLIGHEVGHALYTSEEYLEPIKENNKLMGYMNIIEDVRIEKLIKRKYPGLRKRMNDGYKQLNDRDFFGVKNIQNFDDLLLIDKINLYFKVGYQCGVTFTADEKQFVNRAERCESVQEVIDLAKDIFTYSKEKAEERKQRMQEQGLDAEEEDPIYEDFDLDDEGDWDQEEGDDDDPKPNGGNASKQNDDPSSNEDLESKTERVFKNRLDDLADDSTEYHYWKLDNDFFESPVVDYKTILKQTKSVEQWTSEDDEQYSRQLRYLSDEERKNWYESQIKDYENFKVETTRTVNYLVKEFEMKKSAQLYKRAQTSKIGSLDMRKVYAYKIKDDLFKRVTTLPQGKNHAMIMLVDWSGSMNDVLQDTMKQVISLAQFCNRIQIPYRVFAFTSAYNDNDVDTLGYEKYVDKQQARRDFFRNKESREGNYLLVDNGFKLLELFSNKMTTSEFNSMSKRVVDHRFTWNKGYSTGGTPLNEALAWVYCNLGDFIKHNNVEKTTFITLSDGEGGSFSTTRGRHSLDDVRIDYTSNEYKRIKMKHFIKDEVTQKTYQLSRDSTTQADVVLRMIKDRYNVAVVGFHICPNHKRELRNVICANIPNYSGDAYALIEQWRKDFRQNNFASIKNTARDELFIIPQSSTKIIDSELEVDANAKAVSIAKQFGKFLNVKKTSRILLNRFVALVA